MQATLSDIDVEMKPNASCDKSRLSRGTILVTTTFYIANSDKSFSSLHMYYQQVTIITR